MRRPNRLTVSVILVFLVLLCGCILDSTKPSSAIDPATLGGTANGYFYFTAPSANQAFRMDSTCTIRWRSVGLDSTEYVSIKLFRNDTLVTTITNATRNSRTYSWSVGRVGSGTRYRIKISSYSDTTKYDFSNYFRITSIYSGSISVIAPASGIAVQVTDTLGIQWIALGEIGSYVAIQLWADTVLATTITSSTYSSNEYYRWSSVSTSKGSGDRYRVRVLSYYDSSIAAFSPYFTVNTQYNGTYTITAPDTSSTWAAGSTYPITWSTTGSPGSYARIELYRGTTLERTITSSTSSTGGAYSWSIPAYIVTGEYRIKISSYYDNSILDYSDSFTIDGIEIDDYEPDSIRSSAGACSTNGTVQERSLTYNDTDWIALSLEKGKTYAFRNPTSTQVYVYLYKGNATSYATYFYVGGSSSYYSRTHTADSTMTYYARITPYSSSEYGEYLFSVKGIDSTNFFTVTSPDTNSVWSAGSSYPIQWTKDSAVTITYVNLSLYADTTRLFSITSGSSATNGQYSWSIPSGMATGSRYRIRAEDYSGTGFHGYGQCFTISGLAMDSFEVDNRKTSAGSIQTSGIVQQHTMSYADTDWISFEAQKDSVYLIAATGTPSLYVYLYSSQSTSYLTYANYTNPKIVWPCTTSGTYYIRVSPYSSSYGSYSLRVKSYTQTQLAQFADPNANTTWSAGSGYTLTWSPDTALFGANVNLSLFRGTSSVLTITSSTSNDGASPWTPPAGLASGDNYRIKIQNYSNSQVSGFSDTFSIVGLAPDSYEPDDTISQAQSVIPGGSVQNRSLTYADRDWCTFQADQNVLYRISARGVAGLTTNLYASGSTTALATSIASSSDSNSTIAWFCSIPGNYAFSMMGSSASYIGTYDLALTSYDATQYRFGITSPDTSQVCTSGTSVTISWNDPVSVGGMVDIFLYNADGVVATIVAPTTNDGSHSWNIPPTQAVRNDYYIRVISRTNSNIFGSGGVFAIQ